jgi:hypothetical protein
VVKQTWWSRRALGLHAVILVVVPTFAGLCAWQVSRALDGNELSWAYVFEWPFFAGYAIYMWWRFLHEAPRPPASASRNPTAEMGPEAGGSLVGSEATTDPARAGSDDDEADRAAYNRYLSDLATRGRRKQWR